METKSHYRQDGYEKGFVDGKRTGGKVKKAYMAHFLKTETQNLCAKDSTEFIKGWQTGFADGVREALSEMMEKDGMLENKVYKLD